ncbi:unnamed protein product [Diatraea saccharalis]|uniref:Uncharacterized protein n=1 Tax=Diatraea saccharalis TaxID=40085 RepID=A0A9N9R9D6_9NEOP|nr:unnamed protein product [Diatraea saccharalis]
MAKHAFVVQIAAITTLLVHCHGVIMRNNVLMNKMVSHFQKDFHSEEHDNRQQDREDPHTDIYLTNEQKSEKVLSLMQNVLCRNFPSIPCKIITEDETLKKLIGKSITQIKYKTLTTDRTTAYPGYLTLFPTVNSEDLSNFLQVQDRPYHDKIKEEEKTKKNNINQWSQRKSQKKSKKNKKETKRTAVYTGRKKIRKFYPHKIKYKDKVAKNGRKEFGDYSEEKLSMSVEIPDMTLTKHHQHLSYKVEPADPPVWRIDYMKHGEPSLNMLGYEDERLKGKIMKTGPSVIVDENILEQGARKDVLHPDVYIKKNFIRKPGTDMINNSENMD